MVNNAEPGGGTMNLVAATTHSVNAIYAQLGLDVGPENFDETAHSLGITSPLEDFPAEGIGGLRVGVSPLEMADAYASFADGGIHHDADRDLEGRVPADDNGDEQVDDFEQPEGKRVLSDGDRLRGHRHPEDGARLRHRRRPGIGCPAAGKTGTTDEQTDAWFVGYTPQISTAVWVGYPDSRHVDGLRAFGGSYAAPIWQEYMMTGDRPYCGDFPSPRTRLEVELLERPHASSPTTTQTTTARPPTPTDDRRQDHDRHRHGGRAATTPTSTRPAPARSRFRPPDNGGRRAATGPAAAAAAAAANGRTERHLASPPALDGPGRCG